jgi:ribose transport system substrate-binding protein
MTSPMGSNKWRTGASGPPSTISGLGPHGEFAASVEQLKVPDERAAEARRRGFKVALVLHTTGSDWSKLQVAGVRSTLDAFNATLLEVVDCGFQAERQIEALESLIERRPDAIISIPVSNSLTADAHHRVTDSGIKLVLMDNVPVGMVTGKDCVSVISADNFGNGVVAAEILSNHLPEGGRVGIIGFKIDFFVTNEREIAFRKTMKERRPDVNLTHAEFSGLDEAASVAVDLVASNEAVDGLFVVWDEPAMRVAAALRKADTAVPMTTIDLGIDAAVDLAGGGLIKGLGAQRPYDQGAAEALVAIMSLVGEEPPPWVALAGLAVTHDNVLGAYEAVWRAPAPPELRRAYESGSAARSAI